ncbi:hemoglobin subunit beta-2-like [Discoglossus pictus]
MVHWTDAERKKITGLWSHVNEKEIGAEALARLVIVYPWTQRHFSAFGNLASADAILHNPMVASHGGKVVASIGEAVKHMDDVRGHYAKLSKYHSEKLHVDPANFTRFGKVVSLVLGMHYPAEYTPECQAALEKFFDVVADSLGKCYY